MQAQSNRRQFIKDSAIATAAIGGIVQPFNLLKSKTPANKIQVAIMGVCNRGRALANAFAAARK